jgi:SAM-dependent methyltransferase
MSTAAEFRAYWKDEWSSRVGDSQPRASGRETYGRTETMALVTDAIVALDLKREDALLDIGCAKGLMGDWLRPLVRQYVGLDYIQAFKPRVVADATALPFKNASFDKVLLAGVLMCIPPVEHRSVLTEMRRVIKPSGRGFVAGNPDVYQHDLVAKFDEYELECLAYECGWSDVMITDIDPKLPQAKAYFDMVVIA